MEADFDALEDPFGLDRVSEVCLDELHRCVRLEIDVALRQVINDANALPVSQQPSDDGTADEARASCDKNQALFPFPNVISSRPLAFARSSSQSPQQSTSTGGRSSFAISSRSRPR